MLKASALVYALFISLLLVSLGSAFIVLFNINAVNTASWVERERIKRNAMSGVVFLQGNDNVLINKSQVIDLFENGNDSVHLTKKSWGAFEIDIAEAFSKHHRITNIALSGSGMGVESTMALYLADKDKPLSLCGKTEIKGDCFIPKAGVKRAYIEGQNFIGSELINGKTNYSSKLVDKPNDIFIQIISKIFNGEELEHDSLIAIDQETLPDLKRSFLSNTIVLHASSILSIDNTKLSGNIMLISDKKIVITPDAILNDIIVCAPKVVVENGFSGCIQIFAYDSVVVQEKTNLQYPSLIGLIRQKNSCQNTAIVLKEGVEVTGGVFAFDPTQEFNKQTIITIDKDALVNGLVYTNGSLDLRGSVIGSVICSGFILNTPSSVYENHLLNASIDRTRLSKYFVTANLLKQTTNKKTVKWLY